MASSDHRTITTNHLLRVLTPEDAALVVPHLEPVELDRRLVLERPQVRIDHVYFLTKGIASTIACAGRDRIVEVGLFGREGMSGICVVLGDDRSPHESIMQVAGRGHRMSSDALRQAMDASPTLRLALLRFVQCMLVQTAQTALANAQARLEARLCRWLLMCQDRLETDQLPLTHGFLAMMLGVRRAGVTTTVHKLEGHGLIRTSRGRVQVLDRKGLEIGADAVYGVPEDEYRRLVGVSLRGS